MHIIWLRLKMGGTPNCIVYFMENPSHIEMINGVTISMEAPIFGDRTFPWKVGQAPVGTIEKP